jgi:diadenosine tetraphosphate (Ap4A) HIT family hydrolase
VTACPFCDVETLRRESDLFVENALCFYAAVASDILPGSGIILPRAHRETVFDLTTGEVSATFALLAEVKPLIEERWAPDGFNVGWNCYSAGGQDLGHAHLHVLLRFADEPEAGHGIRYALKQPSNRRPDPAAPGSGRRGFA